MNQIMNIFFETQYSLIHLLGGKAFGEQEEQEQLQHGYAIVSIKVSEELKSFKANLRAITRAKKLSTLIC